MARHSSDPGLSAHDKSVLQKREEWGWFVNKIMEDDKGPGFAYSFGLYEEFKHPEIIIFGLDVATMHQLINDIGKHVRNGAQYEHGQIADNLIEGYSCAFRLVNPLQYRENCTWAVWFYKHTDFPVLQLYWPDKAGRYPWDSGFEDSLRCKQPDLSALPMECNSSREDSIGG
jgi:hypothetical protein